MLNKIYNRLFTNFGPQGWWPYTLDGKLHPTHHGRKPVTEKHRLEIMLSAILTQNTNWKNAEKAIFNLNKEKLIQSIYQLTMMLCIKIFARFHNG